jgi:hypothetical protein
VPKKNGKYGDHVKGVEGPHPWLNRCEENRYRSDDEVDGNPDNGHLKRSTIFKLVKILFFPLKTP